MKLYFITLVCLLLTLASCSEYNKVLKGDDYSRKFSLANELYEKKKWVQSVTLYEQVYQRTPKTSEGELSYFRIGKAYYEEEDYFMSGYYFGSFFEKYPYSSKVEEAFFYKAICSVKNSPNPSLDQQETDVALNDIQKFIYLFPKSNRIDTCNQIMDALRLKKEEKDFQNVKLYAKTLNYKSAVVTSETFLVDYPMSKHKEEIFYILLTNSLNLSKNSIDEKKKERFEKAIETYRTFADQFPSSKYKKELDELHDYMQSQLITINNSK